ncbi:phenylalanine--tRNA ligase subunit beta [Candidatus Woesearchaeota archaeon]|nr:phenylalanine--tRNA ligase subunit beta [Candidatus Woesearchaeota archaeon]
MPSIKINKEVVEKLVGKKVPIDQLKDRISMLGTDLEGIEGNEISVEIFPNRPDLLSEQGLARALSSFIGAKTGLRKYRVGKSGEKVIIDKSVKDVRPFTACAIVKGLKFDDEKIKEIIQIQEKLHVTYGRNRKKCAIGVYPYEKIKPPIKFIAKKPGEIKFQPLEAFKEMTGLQILSQHPTGREYGYLLEGKDKFPIFVDSTNQVLSMPPIINSEQTGKITEKTTDVFVECSGFDFDVLHKCLNIIAAALADMGGKIYSMELSYPDRKVTTPNLEPVPMKFDTKYISRIIGVDFKESEIKKYLEMMGYGYEKGKALVPAYRADVMHPIDLAEDICIAYGYENLKEEIPKVATNAEEDKFYVFKDRIANIFVGLGILEVKTYHLTSKENQTKKMKSDISVIELANPNSKEYHVLRAWIIPSLMEVLAGNKHNEYPQHIFDIGTIFKKGKTDTGVEEADRLGVVLCNEKADFTEIKQVLDYLMKMLDVKYEIEETDNSSFIPGRAGRISVKGKNVAYVGEINPEVLTSWEMQMPVAALEINLTDLFEAIKK